MPVSAETDISYCYMLENSVRHAKTSRFEQRTVQTQEVMESAPEPLIRTHGTDKNKGFFQW